MRRCVPLQAASFEMQACCGPGEFDDVTVHLLVWQENHLIFPWKQNEVAIKKNHSNQHEDYITNGKRI